MSEPIPIVLKRREKPLDLNALTEEAYLNGYQQGLEAAADIVENFVLPDTGAHSRGWYYSEDDGCRPELAKIIRAAKGEEDADTAGV